MWKFPFAILTLLNLADFGATAALIERHGFAVEQNPYLLHWIITANSSWPILVAKLIPIVILGTSLFVYSHRIYICNSTGSHASLRSLIVVSTFSFAYTNWHDSNIIIKIRNTHACISCWTHYRVII